MNAIQRLLHLMTVVTPEQRADPSLVTSGWVFSHFPKIRVVDAANHAAQVRGRLTHSPPKKKARQMRRRTGRA